MESAENATVIYDVTLFGDTVHAFTEPTQPLLKHDLNAAAAYSPYADKRSWYSAMDWLKDVFNEDYKGEVDVSDPYAQPSGYQTYDLEYTDPTDGKPCVSHIAVDTSGT